jgi:hypothetical protein
MNPTSRLLFSIFGRRSRAILIALTGLLSSALPGEATQLLIFSSPGGPMEYNHLGWVPTDTGWVTELSVNFEVPRELRIEKIKAWINGPSGSTATFSVNSVPAQESGWLYSQTFSLEEVWSAPAEWQGLDSLRWNLHPGVYQLFMAAPVVPIGYGYHGPWPDMDRLLKTFDYRDYSEPGNIPWAPFGLEVYGTFTGVPEPSFYGLMGSAGS